MTEPADVSVERSRIDALVKQLEAIDAQRASIEAELADLRSATQSIMGPTSTARSFSEKEKIALFRSLFRGRPDVFAVRWENAKDGRSGYAPACSNEWVSGICGKPKIKCGQCPNQAFFPVTDSAIASHLRGSSARSSHAEFVMGVYPLLNDDTCWFPAADFDDESWSEDALAFLHTCRARGVPAALERSRSGNGGHVWIFFDDPVAARDARQLGAALLTEAMERRPEIRFKSYDRLFPSQDKMPVGGFGNLIALPLARRPRNIDNSVFVDDELRPYADQWAFLASVGRMSSQAVAAVITAARTDGRLLGVRLPIEEGDEEDPWLLPPSRERAPRPVVGKVPPSIDLVLADGIFIDRSDLPPDLVARLLRLAAFQNPEFYAAQSMRLPTYGKPRIVSCGELTPRHINLPRGCLDEVVRLLHANNVRPNVVDRRESGTIIRTQFVGTLQPAQQHAFDAVVAHDFGVLAAGTAFGKTVVAAAAIAHRSSNTLVLVHRRELLTQWVERLKAFLDASAADIGTIGGGSRKPTGRIDVASIQSLVRKGTVSDLVSGYGHLIVDECHHISASTFELVARRSKARFVLGLSATVTRKDGHHPIIFMQCGPVRYRVDPRTQAAQRSFDHFVEERHTAFVLPPEFQSTARPSIPAIFAALAKDEQRNVRIIDDVISALEAGRSPLVLTERREHLEYLAAQLKGAAKNIVVLRGAMNAAARKEALAAYGAGADQERLILATGRYLGEGFDDPRLDTLFLAMPISWKGTLAQYVGRLHRECAGKRDVVVYDYIDARVPVLARMAANRQSGYRALGYRVRSTQSAPDPEARQALSRGEERSPSQVIDDYWIFAERRDPSSYPEHTERGGKWMVFVKNAEVDSWWATIKTATERGLLGGGSKVSTMKKGSNTAGSETRVICVYTYDFDDERDCTRVRETLRDLGVTWKIPYKTDVDTFSGKYANHGTGRVSKRYE